MADYTTSGEIGYLDRLKLYEEEKPYIVTFLLSNTPGAKHSNLSISYHPVNIRDIRHSTQTFTTGTHGFELVKFPTSATTEELRNQGAIRDLYFPEAEQYLKEKFDAEYVYFFDATVRASKSLEQPVTPTLVRLFHIRASCSRRLITCVDQTPASVFRRIKHDLPERFEDFKSRHIRVINIWRPLAGPLQDYPLALCDWRTTLPDDYVACDLPSIHYVGEVLQVHHNPDHQWWFACNMTTDEALLIKMYDTDAETEGSQVAMCTYKRFKSACDLNCRLYVLRRSK
ncbi:uncharacterized protein F5Z01DRAFT_728411 [Emericellopsis atlantica]|uniref:Uncharacterized protein n=1 Tax=Emericellopsis atlantica TaxID=2614577 RepID=A0A9P8CLQ5_9HYPO|nr:uncharacterized protein F5Z01DRAFT_728411 [Emericellopsis atlantica]KAG9251653.1 hypothetical protein F5Z01DRAFT_728411 [Emericellopsis atlantica]